MEQNECDLAVEHLTGALRRGDDEAWRNFHQHYGPTIFRQLLAATWGDHDLATEALQLTYLRVARHVRPCETEAQFRAWLRRVATSVLIDNLRRKSRRNLLVRQLSEAGTDAGDSDDEHRLAEALNTALARLPPEDRTLLEEKYYRGESIRTLAAIREVTEKAVESRLTRARAELRRQMQIILARHE